MRIVLDKNYPEQWNCADSRWIVLDKVYEVLHIYENDFLVCHEGRFFKVPFQRCKRVTKLEEALK
jgi:hypothetical protein